MPVTSSIFDLFRVGPGPSSSHTIGPMEAAADFLEVCRALDTGLRALANQVEVRLFGSLSATGRGHGTVRAVLAGLTGQRPATCAPDLLERMTGPQAQKGLSMDLGAGRTLAFSESDVVFDAVTHGKPYSNAMLFRLLDADGGPIVEREAYSVGGGSVVWQGDPERAAPCLPDLPHPYGTMTELRTRLESSDLSLPRLMLENEMATSGLSREAVEERLDAVLRVMESAVERGIETTGPLPGPLGVSRKAPALFEAYRREPNTPEAGMLALCACAFAASEENAAGHVIVTAPTAGASGVLAATAYAARSLRPTPGVFRKDFRAGLLAAAAVGLLAKKNASVSGAEVGCQGEVGVASAMAAAFLAQSRGLPPAVVENAAEIALEHHLGMTCDPVGGYVQIPCIERNAMGAVKAQAAFAIAAAEPGGAHMVGLDAAIRAMAETGRDMCARYKETSLGGLAGVVGEK